MSVHLSDLISGVVGCCRQPHGLWLQSTTYAVSYNPLTVPILTRWRSLRKTDPTDVHVLEFALLPNAYLDLTDD